MGQGSRPQTGLIAALVVGLACAAAPRASADPIATLPPEGRGVVGQDPDGPGLFVLTAEAAGIAVLAAEDTASLPDYDGVARDTPELGLARIGVFGVHNRWPLAGVLRLDLSEAARVDADDFDVDPAASVDRFIDDAALWWRARRWAEIIVGRQPVPFSRFRQLDVTRLQAGAVPFIVDRMTPDRRWGATLHGDLGAMSYALGGFEDVEALEVRSGEADPSNGGRAAVAFHFEWTPRAPLGGDHLATPSADPWFDTVRVSAGLGVLYRVRRGGRNRIDATVSGQAKWRQLSGIAEILLGSDTGEIEPGVAGQLGTLVTNRISLYTRAEYDRAAATWSAGWGAELFVTADRRSKVGVYGWLRRATGDGGLQRDGAILQLHAAL